LPTACRPRLNQLFTALVRVVAVFLLAANAELVVCQLRVGVVEIEE
jgi:hypothetical protein